MSMDEFSVGKVYNEPKLGQIYSGPEASNEHGHR